MTTTKPPKPRFILHLEAHPRPGGDHDGLRRLRAVLKLLLRCFGFRCTRIDYPDSQTTDKAHENKS